MVTCQVCTGQALRVETQYGIKNTCCGLWSWGDGQQLVDAETHELRKRAHSAFDPLWRQHGVQRKDAYKALADELGIDRKDCHMKTMSKDYLRRVPMAALRLLSMSLNGRLFH